MRFACAALAVFCCAAPIQAQIVRGTVREAGTGAPLSGAFVVLLDSANVRRNATLSDMGGVFVMRAPAAGGYRLRAELIGHQSATSAGLAIPAAGVVTTDMRLAVEPIALEAVNVESARRCVFRPQLAAETIRLWEEARKALTVTQWTETARIGEFQTRTFERQLAWPSLQVLWQGVRTGYTITRPYAAVSPDSLAVYGFVRRVSPDSILYYGPDAEVLLSDQFMDTHCFRARRGERETAGLIGLSFEPARGRTLSDIKGTLWIDPGSSELEFIEFVYTGVDPNINVKGVGGRTYFRRLPNGAWIVDRWFITLPIPRPTMDGIVAAGLLEGGGEIVDVKIAAINQLPKASITGTVYDSVNGMPLPRAFVYLSGTAHSTHTDSAGAFRIADVSSGKYTIAFSHPSLDSLPALPHARSIEVDPPRDVTVQLAVPSAASLAARVCPNLKDTGVITGYARDAEGAVLSSVDVTVSYFHARRWHTQKLTTDAAGLYALCGVPTQTPITLWGGKLREPEMDASGGQPRKVLIGAKRFMRVDLTIQ